MSLGLKRGKRRKIWENHSPKTIYALFSENCWHKILIILLIGLVTSRCFWDISEPTTQLVAWIITGYYIIAYLNQVGIIIINIIIHNYFSWRSFQRCFFDMACDWVRAFQAYKTWIYNKKSYREAAKWWGCFCKPAEYGLCYFPFCTNKNIIIPLVVKETKERYCTYSKHAPTNNKLWFKNLLENIKSWKKQLT